MQKSLGVKMNSCAVTKSASKGLEMPIKTNVPRDN